MLIGESHAIFQVTQFLCGMAVKTAVFHARLDPSAIGHRQMTMPLHQCDFAYLDSDRETCT
jgi:hypothetical protein